MDLFNLPKLIEQGVYDVMMWILFFPITLVRMLFKPRDTLAYVRGQDARDRETAFNDAMRPALFLIMAIIIGTIISPDNTEDLKVISSTRLGEAMIASWSSMLAASMILYCILPLVGALLLNRASGAPLTRETMRLPFDQQCYIGAPSTMIFTCVQAWGSALGVVISSLVLLAGAAWLIYAEWLFFRDNSAITASRAFLLAIATLAIGSLIILALIVALVIASL